MRPLNLSAQNAPVRIGARLRASRLAQGLTLAQLASSAGVTRGFLSRVERDETSPSVASLVQICQALSLDIGELFAPPLIQRVNFDDAPRIHMGGTDVDEWLVSPRNEDRVQVIRSRAEPHATGGADLYSIDCDLEILHVISGSITVTFSDREELVTAGDTLTFPGSAPHNWRAGAEGAEATWAIIPAVWSTSK